MGLLSGLRGYGDSVVRPLPPVGGVRPATYPSRSQFFNVPPKMMSTEPPSLSAVPYEPGLLRMPQESDMMRTPQEPGLLSLIPQTPPNYEPQMEVQTPAPAVPSVLQNMPPVTAGNNFDSEGNYLDAYGGPYSVKPGIRGKAQMIGDRIRGYRNWFKDNVVNPFDDVGYKATFDPDLGPINEIEDRVSQDYIARGRAQYLR